MTVGKRVVAWAGLAAALAVTAAVAVAQDAPKVSVWSGVYTKAQSQRGEAFYEGACAHCHGRRLNGAGAPDQPPAPAIARAGFLRKWAGKPVAELFVLVRTKMPPDNPGTFTDEQAIDSIAHMFAVSSVPPGDKELPADPKALADIAITESK
jgi:mono/diheme cytochrome c family protein